MIAVIANLIVGAFVAGGYLLVLFLLYFIPALARGLARKVTS